MIRGMLLITVALAIDGFQAFIAFALAGIPVVANAIPIIGTIVGAVAEPIGIVLGFVISICISLTFGSLLVWLLVLCKMFYPSRVMAAYTGEVLPGFSMLPAWTALVISSLLKKTAEEKSGLTSAAAGIATAFVLPNNPVGNAMQSGTLKSMPDAARTVPKFFQQQEGAEMQREKTGRTPLINSPRVDGIRPAQKIAGTAAALLLLFGVGSIAHAQSLENGPTPVQFIVSPEVPGPNQSVSIQIQGVGTFLGEATITWQLNGKTEKTGTGERSYSFTTGAVGSQSRVHVSINSASKGIITHDFTFLPSTVNLIWEADTSVPPMYRGKALFSAGSSVTVTAFPQVVAGGSSASAGSLSFQWKRNGTPAPEQSGKGRNTFSFDGDQLKSSEVVSVDVYVGSTRVAQGTLVIPTETPAVLFYARDPLRGTLFDAILPSAISLSAKEITVQAQPYFFSNQSIKNGSLEFDWKINGQSASGPDAQRGILTLRQTGTGAGQASIGVSVQNTDTYAFIQSAQAALNIVFGTQNNSGLSSFFGL